MELFSRLQLIKETKMYLDKITLSIDQSSFKNIRYCFVTFPNIKFEQNAVSAHLKFVYRRRYETSNSVAWTANVFGRALNSSCATQGWSPLNTASYVMQLETNCFGIARSVLQLSYHLFLHTFVTLRGDLNKNRKHETK
jgi:hypothetical protein